MTSDTSPPKKHRIIKADHLLQSKVGRLELTQDVIRKGKDAFENHNIDYTPYAEETMRALEQSIELLFEEPDLRDHHEEDIIARIMQIKANAPQFHYPLMGHLAHIMLEFLEHAKQIDPQVIEILKAHISTLKTILHQKIQSNESAVGQTFERELRAACARYHEKLKAH